MLTIEALTYGPEIVRLLDSGRGHVLAVVSNCVYLESAEGHVTGVVSEHGSEGPLSLRVSNLQALTDLLRARRNLSFRSTRQAIDIGGLAEISLHDAQVWVPRLPEHVGSMEARNEAARAVAESIAFTTIEEEPSGASRDRRITNYDRSRGLGCAVLLCHSGRSAASSQHRWDDDYRQTFFASLRLAHERVHPGPEPRKPDEIALRKMVGGILEFADTFQYGQLAAGEALAQMIGLGPGLTPSGDDLVSGIAASVLWQARLGLVPSAAAEQIANHVQEAAGRTNRISARLLHYACQGILFAPAIDLGEALLAGNASRVNEPARRLFAIGNTSGIDMATGILAGCLMTVPPVKRVQGSPSPTAWQ